MTIPEPVVCVLILAGAALVLGRWWWQVAMAELGLRAQQMERLRVVVKAAEAAGGGVADAVSSSWIPTEDDGAGEDDADDDGPAVGDRAIGF